MNIHPMRHLAWLLLLCTAPAHAVLTVNLNVFNDACGNGTGWIAAFASGGQGPYVYTWSPAPPSGQGTATAQGLVAGSYTVTVTDALGGTAMATGTVETIGTLLPGNFFAGGVTSCDGACNGSGALSIFNAWGGTAPYSASVAIGGSGSVSANHVYLSGLCPGTTYTCTVTDANGCTSTFNNIQVNDLSTPVLQSVVVTPSCAGGETGSAVLTFDQVGLVSMFFWTGIYTYYYPNGNQVTIDNLAPGDYGVEAYPFDAIGGGVPPQMGSCGALVQFTIPVSAAPCGQVDGTVYVDLNGDCIQDASDVPYPWRVVQCAPGGHYELTDGLGQYSEALPYGAYTVGIADAGDHAPLCPATLPAPFTLNAVTPNVTMDLSLEPLYGPDMEALLWSGTPRPGFTFGYGLRALNNGAYSFGPFTATLDYDPVLSYVSSSLPPTVNTPGQLQFTVPSLNAFGQVNIAVVLQVPPDPLLIGTDLAATLTLTPAPADTDPANDVYALSTLVVGAYDPNDKLVRTSSRQSGSLYYLDADTALSYTIRFQNTGNAEALHVRLVDTLSHLLDVASLRLLGASHAFEARLESDSILIIDFPDIMLPDSTSDQAGSQGAFSFAISPHAGIPPGTLLANKADIYFDFNPPIRTNTAVVTAEFSTGLTAISDASSLHVAPNPVVAELRLALGHTGAGQWLVYDVHGRLVRSGHWSGDMQVIQVSDLEAGLYTATVITGTGRSVARFAKE